MPSYVVTCFETLRFVVLFAQKALFLGIEGPLNHINTIVCCDVQEGGINWSQLKGPPKPLNTIECCDVPKDITEGQFVPHVRETLDLPDRCVIFPETVYFYIFFPVIFATRHFSRKCCLSRLCVYTRVCHTPSIFKFFGILTWDITFLL